MSTSGQEWARAPLRALAAGERGSPGGVRRGGEWAALGVTADLPALSTPDARVRANVFLVADPASGERVSALVGKALAAWGLGRLFDDVELCARELFGNVLRHTAAPASGPDERSALVALRWWPGERLRLAVSDRDERVPVLGRPMADPETIDWDALSDDQLASALESGRGLGIVWRTAHALSWQSLASGGKTVWCEFRLTDGSAGSGLGRSG